MILRAVLVVLVVVTAVLAVAFVVDPAGADTIDPVSFDETLSMGMTGVDVREAEAAGYAIPRGQAFYAQYQYVIGYYGVGAMADHVTTGRATRQFGQPIALYVTEYAGAQPTLTAEGFIDVQNDPGVDWVRARSAHFVVDSAARTPAGAVAVPFAAAAAAEAFAEDHGGRVVDWAVVRDRYGEGPAVATERLQGLRAERSAWADRRVDATAALLDRPVSVVVGEDAPTVRAAVDQAPPNTTVRLPAGTYVTNLTITKPLTLRGAGADTVIEGPGTGRVVRANAAGVAVAHLAIAGVGPQGAVDPPDNESAWDAKIELVYGRGDAGIFLTDAPESLVSNVRIATPSNGIILDRSDGTVVRNLTLDGTESWQEGFMGVVAVHSRSVIQQSTFEGGRDGVYTHRADGLVIRDNAMDGMRFGVHEMYTSDAQVANNTVRNTDVGVIVMTRPRGNVLAANDVRGSDVGVMLGGDAGYVTGNVLADNGAGMNVGATRSLYANNTIVDNEVGIRSDTILPTNRIRDNDVVDNDRPATASSGPIAIWSTPRRGNYWGELPALDRDGDGTLDRPYRPTDRIDQVIGRSPAGGTLARGPAVGLVRAAQSAAPGLRQRAAIDLAPRASPARPAVLAEVTDR